MPSWHQLLVGVCKLSARKTSSKASPNTISSLWEACQASVKGRNIFPYRSFVTASVPFAAATQTLRGRGTHCSRLHQHSISSSGHVLVQRGSSRAFTSAVASRPGKRSRRWVKLLGGLVGVSAAVSGAWVVSGDDPRIRLKLLYAVPLRLGRDIVTAVAIAADYEYSLRGLPDNTEERRKAKHEVHLRGANRLQALCFKNGGIYIKLGQHIGQLEFLLPEEYVMTMRRVMLDRCPISTHDQVCAIFLSEFGKLPEEMFAEFDKEPLASASLAQVHAARLHTGEKVAVKVQHGHLTDTAAADIYTVDLVVTLLHRIFPAFDYRWLIDEVRDSLPVELNFIAEAKNNEQCVRNFREKSPHLAPFVALPTVHWDLSSRRLLTMEFMDGVGVTDTTAITQLGLRPADVARLVSEAFSEMIFRHGFVHCDPHAANMLVRVKPKGRHTLLGGGPPQPQLVLLDHGLYRTINDNLRENYAGLWKSLVFADLEAVKHYSMALGAGEDLYQIFASMLTAQTWTKIGDPSLDHLNIRKEDHSTIQMYARVYVNEISELLRRLPRVVLLLLKTNDCLRSVDSALGAPINTFVIVGRESTRALAEIRIEKSRFRTVSRVLAAVDILKAEMWIWTVQLLAACAPTFAWLSSSLGFSKKLDLPPPVQVTMASE